MRYRITRREDHSGIRYRAQYAYLGIFWRPVAEYRRVDKRNTQRFVSHGTWQSNREECLHQIKEMETMLHWERPPRTKFKHERVQLDPQDCLHD